MRPRRLRRRRPVVASLAALALAALPILAYTAANVVASSKADDLSMAISPGSVVPGPCAGMTFANRIDGAGNFNGTNQNDLLMGSGGADTINGQNGDDCLVGGGGDDTLRGGPGNDVCIGGGGTNTFNQCETIA